MPLSRVKWLSYGALNAPAAPKPSKHQNRGTAQSLRPLRDRQSFAIMLQIMRRGRIKDLLASCGPSAISMGVAFIVIFAVKFKPVWSRPHISKEVYELSPALANSNPAPAVAMVFSTSRIQATLKHTIPNPVFSATFLANSAHAVDDAVLLTSARNVSSELINIYRFRSAAVASANNKRAAYSYRKMFYNFKAFVTRPYKWVIAHIVSIPKYVVNAPNTSGALPPAGTGSIICGIHGWLFPRTN